MAINVLVFGQLKEITGNELITVEGMDSSDKLIQYLHSTYPALKNAKYIVAVEKEVISANTVLKDGNSIALLPPYAGG